MNKRTSDMNIFIWIGVSFLIWIYCFRGFVTGELAFESDAVAYYQHIKFFADNLMKGVYPLWDPSVNSGAPSEFFLRRIGSFNPFFLIVVALRKLGVPNLLAYNFYLSAYYLLGGVGFYKLTRLIFKNPLTAYFAFLVLYFSSLGTRQFDSYIILVFVPMIWFFYFFISFCQKPTKHGFMGIIFCLMNLATTYIPLYFMVILLSFMMFVVPFYIREIPEFFRRCVSFLVSNKMLSILCLIALILSLLPAIMMFKSADKAEFVMPMRGSNAFSKNALEVGKKDIVGWNILNEVIYTSALSDLGKYKFAVIFFPGIFYLVFLLGLFTRVNKNLILLFLWGGFLLLLGSPGLSPIHQFFYSHVFFFKYFRNLHWFLWLAIFPIFVLFGTGQFDQLMEKKGSGKRAQFLYLFFIVFIHAIFAALICKSGNETMPMYICIFFSLVFFVIHALDVFDQQNHVLFLLLTLMVGIQSIDGYNYLNANSKKRPALYVGEISYDPYAYRQNDEEPTITAGEPTPLYYSLKNFNDIYSNVDMPALYDYKNNKFIIYDSVEYMNIDYPDYAKINQMLKKKENVAYIHTNDVLALDIKNDETHFQVPNENTSELSIVKASVNSVTVRTNFMKSKFLVFNNTFHRYWKLTLNGKREEIIPTNIAFQGVYIPSGENILVFHFGSVLFRLFNYGLLVIFYGLFSAMCISWYRDYKKYRRGIDVQIINS